MLTNSEKLVLRTDLFKYLDGLVTAPVAYVLFKNKILTHLLEHKKVNLKDLAKTFKTNDGYLNVALRVLASQGWLVQHLDNASQTIEYATNSKSRTAFELCSLYKEVWKIS